VIGRLRYLLALGVLISLHLLLYTETFTLKESLDQNIRVNYVLPAEFSQVAALDFQGLAADFQLLQGIFFIGEKIDQQVQITDAEWDYFTLIIKAVIKLDPYFYDTYHLATGILTWGVGRYQDAIDILETGRKFNPEDYRYPYQIGFIHFYFLNDAQKGAQYLELASRLPDAPPLLASLASRLAYYKGNYKFSINLLERMLSSERSPEIRQYYQRRLDALQGALALEKAVQEFKTVYFRLPSTLQELIDKKLIETLPQDPYGGDYIILESGRVYSTSKFTDAQQKKPSEKQPASN
jgi:hypothetical protein